NCLIPSIDKKSGQIRILGARLSGGTSNCEIKNMVMDIIMSHGIKGRVLDFGAGKGELIKLLSRIDDIEPHGVDIMKRPEDIPTGVSWRQQDLSDEISFTPEYFDAALCSEVLKHLENPRSVFRSLFVALRPGGKLVLTMPNQENVRSFLTLIFRDHFASFQDQEYPAHITALLRTDLIRMCQETGFSEPHFYYTNCGWMPKARTTWQKASLNLLRGRLFSDNLGMAVIKLQRT